MSQSKKMVAVILGGSCNTDVCETDSQIVKHVYLSPVIPQLRPSIATAETFHFCTVGGSGSRTLLDPFTYDLRHSTHMLLTGLFCVYVSHVDVIACPPSAVTVIWGEGVKGGVAGFHNKTNTEQSFDSTPTGLGFGSFLHVSRNLYK